MSKIFSLLLFIINFIYFIGFNYVNCHEVLGDEDTRKAEKAAIDDPSLIDIRVFKEVQNSVHFENMENYQEFVYRNDITFMTYFYSKNNTFSKMGAHYLYRLENKLDFLAKIVFIDCDTVKDKEKIKDCNQKSGGEILLPRIKLAVPPKEKYNPITKKIDVHKELNFRESSVSSEILENFIVSNLISHTQEVTAKNLKTFQQQSLLNKVLIFHDEKMKEKKDSEKSKNQIDLERLIKGFSNIYYDRISIGEVFDNSLALREFNITEYPKMVIMESSFFRWEKPNVSVLDKPLIAKNMYPIFEKYATKEKMYLRRLFELSIDEVKAFPLMGNTFHVFMEKFINDHKMIYFTFNESNQFQKDISEEITAFNGLYVFAKINCKLYFDICKDYFNIDISEEKILQLNEDFTNKKINSNIFNIRFYPGSDYIDNNTIHKSIINSQKVFELTSENVDSNDLTKQIKSSFFKFTNCENSTEKTELEKAEEKTINNDFYKKNVKKVAAKELSNAIFESRNEEKYSLIFLNENNSEENNSHDFNKLIFDSFSGIQEYSDKLDFIEVENAAKNEKLKKLLKVKSLPAVIIAYHNKIDDEGFKTKFASNHTIIELRKLVENFISDVKFKPVLSGKFFEPIIMEDPFYLLSKCIYNQRPCLIAFLDGEYISKPNINQLRKKVNYVNPSYYKELDKINELATDNSMYDYSSFFVINATCHYHTMKSFKIQYKELPQLVYYTGPNENYAKFPKHESYDDNSEIIKFINKCSKGLSHNKELEKKDVLVNRLECVKIMDHKDRNHLFDFGGVEFEEYDSDTTLDEDDEIDRSMNSEFDARYNKIMKEAKEKGDL